MSENAFRQASIVPSSQTTQDVSTAALTIKREQFIAAMELYNSGKAYKLFDTAVAITNISLQLYLLYRVMQFSIGIARQVAAMVAAFVVADFINGLVHMFMDQNDDYESIAGPLIANFHLHHKTPRYKKNPLAVVYFNESGSKVWLVGYLATVSLLAGASWLNPTVLHILVYTGILSSVAEVSHYLCHSSNAVPARLLAEIGFLLSKRHHARHHVQDNTHYAFLNGFTDPLINVIARKYSKGYKNGTDLHYAHYTAGNPDGR
ncbi:MAG: hypothetical protein CSYNP_02737 [Syntrophus sp. SKADARSKE-3]|nr:hypothetical protein [Syntrophus sp. SKADARSKE-3]